MSQQRAFPGTAATHDDKDIAMVDGKVEIAHEDETAEGHGEVAHGDVRLGAVGGDCFSNHSNSQDIKNNGEGAAGNDDGNDARHHSRRGRISDGGRAVA